MWHENYVGLRFVKGGRDRRGLDCWGLVRLVLMEQRGLVLPDYLDCFDPAEAIRAAKRGGDWLPVSGPQECDVMVMLTPLSGFRIAPMHVGVMVAPRRLLHIDDGRRSEYLDANHPTIRARFEGYYRHRSFMAAAP
jgi:NlpC/P60 family